jgi:hypothetical protein
MCLVLTQSVPRSWLRFQQRWTVVSFEKGAASGFRRWRGSAWLCLMVPLAGILLALLAQAGTASPDVRTVSEPSALAQACAERSDGERGSLLPDDCKGMQDPCAWQEDFTWADLGGGATAMALFDDGSGPALYVGGSFPTAGGVVVNNIARWDGSSWAPLAGPSGVGTDLAVWTLEVFDDGSGPALFVGGYFDLAGGIPAHSIARWRADAWSSLSSPSTGLGGSAFALEAFGAALYAGGSFTEAGDESVSNIARWDGFAWTPLGSGADSRVTALAAFDDGIGPALYAGGWFTIAGGVVVNRVARWDGGVWSSLSGPSGAGVAGEDSSVFAFADYDDGSGPALFVGGYFATAGGVVVNNIARWDGSAWSALFGASGTGVSSHVLSLAVFDDGSGPALYAGGFFTTAASP